MLILHCADAVVGIDCYQYSCVIHFGDDAAAGDDDVADVGIDYHDNTVLAFASDDGLYNVLVVDHDSLLPKMIRRTALGCSCSAASCAYDEQLQLVQGRLALQAS